MPFYTVSLPKRILFGTGVSTRLAEELSRTGRRVLVVCGRHVRRDGTAEEIASALRDSGREVKIMTLSGLEPTPEDVDKTADAGRQFAADALIAIGGGSVIDTGKAAAALLPLKGVCAEYFNGGKTIPGKGVFFAALPTTAGTGAEMTNNSVLTDPATKIKKSLRSPFMTADLALVDPELTSGCPAETTAASGLDALVQAAESYTNPKGETFSRALALEALKKIFFALKKAYAEPGNAAARADMAEGSMLGGMSFAQCGLGAIHGLAHPVGSLLRVPHGIACAVLMPYIFEFNLPAAARDYAAIAEALGLAPGAESFAAAARELAHSLGVPATFSAYGLAPEHFPFIIKNCRSASMKSNPRAMSDLDVENLLKKLV